VIEICHLTLYSQQITPSLSITLLSLRLTYHIVECKQLASDNMHFIEYCILESKISILASQTHLSKSTMDNLIW